MSTKRWRSIIFILLLSSLLACNREPFPEESTDTSSTTNTPSQQEVANKPINSVDETKVDELRKSAEDLSKALTSFKENPSDPGAVEKIKISSEQLVSLVNDFREAEGSDSEIVSKVKTEIEKLNFVKAPEESGKQSVILKITEPGKPEQLYSFTSEEQLKSAFPDIVEGIDAANDELNSLLNFLKNNDGNSNPLENNTTSDQDRGLAQENSSLRIVILVAFVLSLGLLLGFIVFAFKKSSQHQSRKGRAKSISGNQTQRTAKSQPDTGNIQTGFPSTSFRRNRKTPKYLTQDDLAPILDRIEDIEQSLQSLEQSLQSLANQYRHLSTPEHSYDPPNSSPTTHNPQPAHPVNSPRSQPTWQPPKPVPSLDDQIVRQYNQNPSSFKNRATLVDESEHTAGERRAGSRVAITLGKNKRGNYWLIEEAGELLLVPKAGINVNEHNYKTLELMFDCYNAQPGYTKTFNLLKPAKVNRQGQLIEKGQLQF